MYRLPILVQKKIGKELVIPDQRPLRDVLTMLPQAFAMSIHTYEGDESLQMESGEVVTPYNKYPKILTEEQFTLKFRLHYDQELFPPTTATVEEAATEVCEAEHVLEKRDSHHLMAKRHRLPVLRDSQVDRRFSLRYRQGRFQKEYEEQTARTLTKIHAKTNPSSGTPPG